MATKVCCGCDIEKPLSEFSFKIRKDRGGRRYYASRCKTCASEYQIDYQNRKRLENPDFDREGNLRRLYGMTLAEYDELFEAQDGVCAICGSTNTNGHRLVVDHDHGTKEIRGLLCHNCNRGMGLLQDNSELLYKAGDYLKKEGD